MPLKRNRMEERCRIALTFQNTAQKGIFLYESQRSGSITIEGTNESSKKIK